MQPLHLILRSLSRNRRFTVGVVSVLALGIGANSAMFGVVDHLLLSPPPHVVDPEGVVRLQVHSASRPAGQAEVEVYQTFADYQDYLAARSLEQVAAFGVQEWTLGRGENAAHVTVQFSTGSLFPLLGVKPALGRFFDDAVAPGGGNDVVVLSHGLWQRHFGGSADVLGRSLSVGSGTYTVVGVAPKDFNGVNLARVDLYLPIHAFTAFLGSELWTTHRGFYWLEVLGRLPSSAIREGAEAEVTALHRNGRRTPMEQGRYPGDARIVFGSVNAALGPNAPGEVEVTRWLVVVTLLVLLIACANVANLLLARGVRRQRDLGIQVALGLSRVRLTGQLLAESLALSGVGALAALVVAFAVSRVMRAVFLPDVAWPGSIVQPRVLLFTAAAAVITGLLAGAVPAWRTARGSVASSLREGGRSVAGRSRGGQSALVVVQATLAVVLLAGAGLFIRSLYRARNLDLGLNPEGVVLATLELDGDWGAKAMLDLSTRATHRLERLPGVTSVAVASQAPFQGRRALDLFVPGVDSVPFSLDLGPFVVAGSSGHLSTLGIGLRQGRALNASDMASGARVVIVTANMARGIWGTEAVLGACLQLAQRDGPCWEVVGVAEANRVNDLTGDEPWQYYIPLGEPAAALGIVPGILLIRARGDPHGLSSIIKTELLSLDPAVRFAYVRPQLDHIEPLLGSWRLGATMFMLFGGIALLVASVGLYSVLAFGVAERTRELAIRTAVGATRTRLMVLVIRKAVALTAAGVFFGLLASFLGSGAVEAVLFETSPRDPLIFVGVGGVLLAVSVLAAAVPASVAARVEPVRALSEG